MLRKLLFPFLSLLVLINIYELRTKSSTSYQLGAFSLPRVLFSSELTRDTNHLPAIQFLEEDRPLSPRTERYLRKGINFMHKFYITKFGYAFPKDFTVKIRVFRDLSDYQNYTSQVASSPIKAHIGLYVHHLQEIIVWQGPDSLRFMKTVFHETSHLMLRSQSNFCPRWLNEGLSEYFEELDVTGEVPVINPQPRKDLRLKERLAKGEIPCLNDYLTQTNRQWSRADNSSDSPRMIAWSLVYYLMEKEEGQQVVKDMLHYFKRYQSSPDQITQTVNTFTEMDSLTQASALGANEPILEQDWLQWIGQQRMPQSLDTKVLPSDYWLEVRKWIALNQRK